MPKTHNDSNSSGFESIRRKTTIIGIVVLSRSIVLVLVGEGALTKYPVIREILKAVALALLSIGAVSLIYELQLRREVQSELLRRPTRPS